MAKPLPMPIGLVVNHPAVVTLPNAAWHITVALCLAYWQSECRPLPTANHDRAAIGRTDVSTFARHCYVISSALEAVCPILTERMTDEWEKLLRRVAKSRAGAVARYSRRASERATEIVTPTPPTPPTDALQALARAPLHSNPKTDMPVRRAAVARHEGIQRRGVGATLTDEGGGAMLVDRPPAIEETPDTAFLPWTWEPGAPPRDVESAAD